MTEPTLAERMKDYFTRQIAWLEFLIAGFDTLEADLQAEQLNALAERQAADAAKTRDLEEEFMALWKEWQAQYQTVPGDERVAVKEMATQAEELSLRLGELSEQAERRVEDEMKRVKGAILSARKNRENLNRYGSDTLPAPGFMDKKA